MPTKHKNVFSHTKMPEKADEEQKKKVVDFFDLEGIPMTLEKARSSYAVNRYAFSLDNVAFFDALRPRKLADKLGFVLGVMNCTIGWDPDEDEESSSIIVTVPRRKTDTLYLGDGIDKICKEKNDLSEVTAYLGEFNNGHSTILHFGDEMSHCLLAGTTGSGKTTALADIIFSIAYKYSKEEVRMYLFDSKNNLASYKDLPQVAGYGFDLGKIADGFYNLKAELQRRKDILAGEDIKTYNSHHKKERLPRIIIIFDEIDNVIARRDKDVLKAQVRAEVNEIAEQGRSLGMHLLLASQKPSAANLDTNIRSNIPGRIALRVMSQADSRMILNAKGAEKLSKSGEGFFLIDNGELQRLQCAFVPEDEKEKAMKELCK